LTDPVPIARARPPTIAFRRPGQDGFPVAVFRREAHAPVHAPVMHTHRFFALLYADGGSGVLNLPGLRVPLGAGDLHIVPPGEPHDTSELDSVTGWAMEFTADVLGDDDRWSSGLFAAGLVRPRWFGFLDGHRLRVPKLSVPEGQRRRFEDRFAALAAELAARPLAYQDAVRAELSLLLVDLCRLAAPADAPARRAPLVDEVFALIDTRYAEPLSLRHVARAVGRSASHVTHVVREQTGLTVVEWIVERRLHEARRRLRDTDEQVAIIAERVGFGSVNHFLRQFRKAHGISPNAWRRSLQGSEIDKSVDSLVSAPVHVTQRSPTPPERRSVGRGP
jgi:AraC-like DNA-binding protein